MMRQLKILCISILIALASYVLLYKFVFTFEKNEAPTKTQIQVVATNSILGDLVQQIGGEKISLSVIVGPMEDAHTFDPTPISIMKLKDAAIFFENGLGFEPWATKFYLSSKSKALRSIVSKNISPILVPSNSGLEEDPHIWQDISNVILMVQAINEDLSKTDPTNQQYYNQKTTTYIELLKTTETWVFETIKNIPKENRKIITSHDSFRYFGKRYDFEIVDSILGSLSTEVADPSAQKISHLIEKIKSLKVSAIFTENISNSKIADQIANESGIKIAPPLFTDALGTANSNGETYLKMIKHNVKIFAEYLQ